MSCSLHVVSSLMLQIWWFCPLTYIWPCTLLSASISVGCCCWRPGDTLLHWAIRYSQCCPHRNPISDEMLLALLEAGYDADAPNLGCPCLCCCPSCQATTPRQMINGWCYSQESHIALLSHVAPKAVEHDGRIVWQMGKSGKLEPFRFVGGEYVPLPHQRLKPGMLDERVRCSHPAGAHHGDFPSWTPLVSAIKHNKVDRFKELVSQEDFDVHWRPNFGCCGAETGTCNDGNQVQ